MATFNFAAFLAKIDQDSRYEIEPLSGGLVNPTVRARKTDSGAVRGAACGVGHRAGA
jgi:hypothetical protein